MRFEENGHLRQGDDFASRPRGRGKREGITHHLGESVVCAVVYWSVEVEEASPEGRGRTPGHRSPGGARP